MNKVLASLLLIGAAYLMYLHANHDGFPIMERFSAFVYMGLFGAVSLFVWTRK